VSLTVVVNVSVISRVKGTSTRTTEIAVWVNRMAEKDVWVTCTVPGALLIVTVVVTVVVAVVVTVVVVVCPAKSTSGVVHPT